MRLRLCLAAAIPMRFFDTINHRAPFRHSVPIFITEPICLFARELLGQRRQRDVLWRRNPLAHGTRQLLALWRHSLPQCGAIELRAPHGAQHAVCERLPPSLRKRLRIDAGYLKRLDIALSRALAKRGALCEREPLRARL